MCCEVAMVELFQFMIYPLSLLIHQHEIGSNSNTSSQQLQKQKVYRLEATLNVKTFYLQTTYILHRLHFTPECKILDPEQNIAEQTHARPSWLPSCPAVQHTFNTMAAAALSCLVWAYVFVCACSCVYVSPTQGLSDRSCPYLYAGLRGKADLSPEVTSKRPGMG